MLYKDQQYPYYSLMCVIAQALSCGYASSAGRDVREASAGEGSGRKKAIPPSLSCGSTS
jgi:hypothetical protein